VNARRQGRPPWYRRPIHLRRPDLRVVRSVATVLIILTVGAGLLTVVAGTATAKPPPHPTRAQLKAAQARKDALAGQVGALSAKVATLQGRIVQLDAAAELAEQKVANALAQLAAAQDDADAARARVASAQAEVAKATRKFGDFVRASYMSSPINGAAGSLLTAHDPNAVLARTDYLQYSAAHKTDAISNLSRATVTKSNADAAARQAVQRQTTAADAARTAQQAAAAALATAKTEKEQLRATLSASQAKLDSARTRLATLNHQRARYLAWKKEQARIAAARAAAERKRRAEALAAAQARARDHGGSPGPVPVAPTGGKWSAAAGQTAVNRAMQYLGMPYAFAAGNFGGPTWGVCVSGDAWNDCHVYGFDCSGLTLYGWAPYLHMDHYAATQYGQAGSYHPSQSNLMPGDLVFWSSDGSQAGIHHVAMYIGGGDVVQAPQSGDIVRVTPLGAVDSGYYGATRPLT
jgi:cell wall-associated NlpC family hydrolase